MTTRMILAPHSVLRVTAVAVALMLVALASPAYAAVLDADYIGAAQVKDAPALRTKAPDLYVPSGVLTTMDGRELWARDPASRRAMASTTKIMTAVVVLERANLSTTVTVDRTAAKVGESVMGLVPGEKIAVGELLKGVLVQSGNDAATLVAELVGGSVDGFVKMMNAKALDLDLVNTAYVNPHGLDAKGHFTSAEDLTALARYAMRIPLFRETVGTYTVKVRSDRFTHVLTNHNSLLKTYAGAEGVKTGWTDDAGYCVVFAAKRGDVELIGTVMGAASEGGRAQQATALLDWGFAHYRVTTVATAGEALGRVRVSDYLERTVGAVAAETTSMPVFDLAGPVQRRVELRSDVPAPVTKGDTIGTMTLYQGTDVLAQVPLVASQDVPAPSAWQRVMFFFARIWRSLGGS
ncbi:MAG TPA: D-alanyl-D-alanine carboxypeptidase family protein [Coriobacteriia bacterium]